MTTPDPPADGVRVIIVDAEALVRQGLSDRLNRIPDIDVVAVAATTAEAIDHVVTLTPDVAIVDAELPDGGGIELCRQISTRNPATRCILHTGSARQDHQHGLAAIPVPAVVLKQLFGDELVRTIRTIAAERRP